MDLTVKTVQDDNGNLVETLGISPERFTKLVTATVEILRTSNNVTDSMERVSKMCVHPNELAYTCYVLGKAHQVNEMGMDMSRAADALERGLEQ